MIATLVLLAACGTEEIVVSHDAPGCENVDPEHPPRETLEVEQDGVSWHVIHYGVFEACSAEFDPEIETDGRVVTVREIWLDAEDDSCTTCFAPRVTLKDPPPGKYGVFWYVDEGDVPFDNVSFKVE